MHLSPLAVRANYKCPRFSDIFLQKHIIRNMHDRNKFRTQAPQNFIMNAFREFLNVEIIFFKNHIHDGAPNDLKKAMSETVHAMQTPFRAFWGLSCNHF